MKLFCVFRKSLREQLRSGWDLILAVTLGPAMVLLYWSFFGSGGSTNYPLLVVNEDNLACVPADNGTRICTKAAIEAISTFTYADGESILTLTYLDERSIAMEMLRNGKASALIIFPNGFTETLRNTDRGSPPPELLLVGDLTNPYYPLAALVSTTAIQDYYRSAMQQPQLLTIREVPLGSSAERSEFEMYIPGMLIVAVTLMLYSVSMAVAREVENGTIRRLQLTSIRAADYLGGISLLYLILALSSVLLTFFTARALGFHSQGPLWIAILVAVLTCPGVIGIGMITGCFSKTVGGAAIMANFPLIILLFFSGGLLPLPRLNILNIGGRDIALFDILPTTHGVQALNKVLTLGAGLGDIGYELSALIVISVIYFFIGVMLFQRMHFRHG